MWRTLFKSYFLSNMEKEIVEKVQWFPKPLDRSSSLLRNKTYKENLRVFHSGETDPSSKSHKAQNVVSDFLSWPDIVCLPASCCNHHPTSRLVFRSAQFPGITRTHCTGCPVWPRIGAKRAPFTCLCFVPVQQLHCASNNFSPVLKIFSLCTKALG